MTFREPAVSVIMPAYNAARTIATAVQSVLEQTFSDLELIVCDDASSDRTAEALAAIQDSRLRIIRNVSNSGKGNSRDRAIAAAVAPWLAVIDADDAWAPNRLERLISVAPSERDRLLFDDIMICHDVNGSMVQWKPLRGSRAFERDGHEARDVPIENYIRADRLLIKPLIPTACVRNNGILHSDRSFAEDAEFFFRLAATGIKFVYLPEPLYMYRITPNSETAKANDFAAMRSCMEDCARMIAWPVHIERAFEEKISCLRFDEILHQIAFSARNGQFLDCLRLAASNPKALTLLPNRLRRFLSYQVHRQVKGGARR